jgi:hypothetical protein
MGTPKMEAFDMRCEKRHTFIFAARKARLLMGIFSVVFTSLDGTGGPLEDRELFGAGVPFVEMGRWVTGL